MPSFGQPAAQAETQPHKLKVHDPATGREIEANGGRLIADYGNFKLYESSAIPFALGTSPLDEVRDEYNFIELNAGRIDTRTTTAKSSRKSIASFTGKRLHLIQFAGPVSEAWRQEILDTGSKIISYIPENTYLVYGAESNLTALQAVARISSHIQWEGAFQDSFKVHPLASDTDTNGNPRNIGTDMFTVQVVRDDETNPRTLQFLERFRTGDVIHSNACLDYVNFTVKLAPGAVRVISAQPDVVAIHPFFQPRTMCERQDQIIAGNLTANSPSGPGYLAWLTSLGFNQAQFTASGIVVDVTDHGIDNGTTLPGHFGLYKNGNPLNGSRVAYNRLEGSPNTGSTLQGCDGHGTINAHIIAGYDAYSGFPFTDAAGYAYGLGVCPFVSVGSSVIFDPNYTFPDFTLMMSQAYTNGARISNNSWDYSLSAGTYSSAAQLYDSLVRDSQPTNVAGNQQMVIVFAAGDDGPTNKTVDDPGTAKNVITVGASENVQPFGGADRSGITDAQADNASDIWSGSSRGPCADGRNKPDLCAPGTHVSGGLIQASFNLTNNPLGLAGSCYNGSSISGGPSSIYWPPGQVFYTASSGTSQSAPCVAGGCALVMQYFLNNYGYLPSPAMVKAYLINSARYLTGLYANDTLPSSSQGMGAMNLGTAFDGVPRFLRDQTSNDLFTASGQSRTYVGTIPKTNKPFRVTLAWTDAPGSLTGKAYNNNLDLVVTVGTNTYKGNVFNGAYSTNGGTSDLKNNVENVFLPAGSGTNFNITVSATSINSIGVPNAAHQLQQDFSLVAYNANYTNSPIITANPTNTFVALGSNAQFTVSAIGAPPLYYNWMLNSNLIAAATNSSLNLTNLQLAQSGGVYSVLISNLSSSVTSAPAVLAVVQAPSVTLNPSNILGVVGGHVILNSIATGGGLAYRWSFKSIPTIATNPGTLAISNLSITNLGTYSLYVSNAAGSASASAVVQATLPQSTITRGNAASQISMPSLAGLTYVLQYKDSISSTNWITIPPPVPGTGSNLIFSDPVTTNSSRYYRVVGY